MKHLLWIILILIVAFGGYYWFTERQNADDGEVCAQVVTDARNPETGEVQTFPTPCDVPEGWEKLETDREEFTRDGETWKRYRNDDLGLRFEYRLQPDGYVLVEQDEGEIPLDTAVEFVSLFNAAEYAELMDSDEPREGPPSISVIVYTNPADMSARAWAEEHTMVSQIDLALSEVEDTELSGYPAVRYRADGLYASDIFVVDGSAHIYFISGAFIDENSAIRDDFLEMIEYVELY